MSHVHMCMRDNVRYTRLYSYSMIVEKRRVIPFLQLSLLYCSSPTYSTTSSLYPSDMTESSSANGAYS